jgi:hypothetical protein
MPASHAQHASPQDLATFAAGKLAGAQAGAGAAHLEACPACRQAVANPSPASFLGKRRAAGPGTAPAECCPSPWRFLAPSLLVALPGEQGRFSLARRPEAGDNSLQEALGRGRGN